MRPLTFTALLFSLLLSACRQNDPAATSQQPPATADQAGSKPSLDSAAAAVRQPNPWADRGCELVTDAEVLQLFGVEPNRDIYNSKALPGQGYCLRFWNRPDWKEREQANENNPQNAPSPRVTLVSQVLDYGTDAMSQRQFETLVRERRNGYDEPVAGLGDGAVWSNSISTLLVRKGHLCLQLSLDWADQPHDNLGKAKEIAALALKKM